ncbi:MAG: hypothetical protein A2285_08985 [Elusimicrobia bacterium RIFOXYA12_FULL_57_11]|nr:MAG: hypothetical protein A2285_08985 [Elusimicrobia bacterium RIFOXYA12_FULL_57_11]
MVIRLLIKNGCRVTVIAPEQPRGAAETGYDLVLMRAGIRDFLAPHWFEALRTAFSGVLEKSRPDRIFSESYYALGLEKAAAGIPVTAFVHNFHLVHFQKLFSEVDSPRALAYFSLITIPRLFSHMFRYEIPFLHRSEKVISVSQHNAGLLKRYYRLPQEKVAVLHNWVETDIFSPCPAAKAAAKLELGLNAETTVFLAVGSLWRPKGFHIAIEAFKRLAQRRQETVLLLAGAGPYEARLKRAAGESLLSGRIRFLGEVQRTKLPPLYNAADIFLMPSIHPEGLAYTLIEAMSSGLPIIATALGGNIETAGDTGLLVPCGDVRAMETAMLELAANRILRERLAGCARARALELFSENTAREKIRTLLQ